MTPPLTADLDAMLALPRGWDGYGADPVTPAAVAAGKVVVGLLDPRATGAHVAPGRDGGLMVGWRFGPNECELDISPAGTVTTT
jgi:hypothetical protein